MLIQNERELNDIMTAPSAAIIEFMKKLVGDIIIIGAGGKMGPSLCVLAARAIEVAGVKKRIFAVSRFNDTTSRQWLQQWDGIQIHPCNLLDSIEVARLPEVPNLIFMAGAKFGTSQNPGTTWVTNTVIPSLIARRYQHSNIVVMSTGNVYPFVADHSAGCTEQHKTAPVGEYAWSALAREQVFRYFANEFQIPMVLLRLNYAIDLRYGVLLDIAQKVFTKQTIRLETAFANIIWQGDAIERTLRSFQMVGNPTQILNVTGPKVAMYHIAERFGQIFDIKPIFEGSSSGKALLSDASVCSKLFGQPTVTLDQMIEWVAHWVKIGGLTLGKPTKFEVQDGNF